MEVIIEFFLLLAFILIAIAFILDNKLINKYAHENKKLNLKNEELRLQLDYAEKREIKYLKKLKSVEHIIAQADKSNEFAIVTLQNIKKTFK